jgi:hypothetical protein
MIYDIWVDFERIAGSRSTDSVKEMPKKIQSALTKQFISRAYRLICKTDDKLFTTVFLMFEILILPSFIYISYEQYVQGDYTNDVIT